MGETLTRHVCRKLTETGWEDAEQTLVSESALTITVNGVEVAVLNCTPADPEELVTGYLLTAGVIQSAAQILLIDADFKKGCANVQVIALPQAEKPKAEPVSWTAENIWKLHQYVVQDAPRNRGSHSTHSCTLLLDGEIVCCREDVGRHNAIDRAVGWAAQRKIPLSRCIAFFSGRISAEAVRKLHEAGVQVLCAKALPTEQAAQLAAKFGMTLLHCSERRGILQF